MRVLLFAVPLLILGPALEAAEPSLGLDPARRLLLIDLPPVLAETEVERQLTTGLTTTFVFRVELDRGGSGRVAGGARVEVRYELWDEVFHTTVLDARGIARGQVPSLEELAGWWHELRLAVLAATAQPPPTGRARVTLEVVPFSQAEAADTQRWFADAVAKAGSSGGEGISSPDDREDSLGQVFSVLLATSIQRHPVTSFRWQLDLPAGELP